LIFSHCGVARPALPAAAVLAAGLLAAGLLPAPAAATEVPADSPAASAADSLAAPPGGSPPADSTLTRVRFHDYALSLPASEGWALVKRAPEDEAITVRLVWQRGGEAFTLGQMVFERLGLFDPGAPREPRAAFARLADRAERDAREQVRARPDVAWAGARRDTLALAGRVLHRLQYGVRSGATDGLVWVVFWFPSSFARDGFYVRATLQMWRRPDREDLSVLDDFAECLGSLTEREPTRDRRIIPDGPDRLGQARRSLPDVYYDARQQVLRSPHDTTQAVCTVQLEDTLAVALQATRLPGVTFVAFYRRVPAADDRSPGERFGKAFDRDEDGRFDLVFFSQGWAKGVDQRDIRTFYVVADDDGDGRVDAMVFEDGNNDRDQLVDCSVLVQDRGGGGEPDRAWVVDTDLAHPVRPIPHQGAVFLHGLTSRPGDEALDFSRDFREWSRCLGWLNRAAAQCRARGAARR
jgi:hypothetical protein